MDSNLKKLGQPFQVLIICLQKLPKELLIGKCSLIRCVRYLLSNYSWRKELHQFRVSGQCCSMGGGGGNMTLLQLWRVKALSIRTSAQDWPKTAAISLWHSLFKNQELQSEFKGSDHMQSLRHNLCNLSTDWELGRKCQAQLFLCSY